MTRLYQCSWCGRAGHTRRRCVRWLTKNVEQPALGTPKIRGRETPIQTWAAWKVRQAIAAGKLVRKPCAVCGAARAHACHDDYLQPLDVVWLCVADKRRRRAELGPPKNGDAKPPAPSKRGGSLPLKVRMELKRRRV